MGNIELFEQKVAPDYKELFIERISVYPGMVTDNTERRLAELAAARAYYKNEAALKAAFGAIGPFYLGVMLSYSESVGTAHVQRLIMNTDPKQLDWSRVGIKEYKKYHVGDIQYKAYYDI